ATREYNCIAWAAGDTEHWWWPDLDPENDAIFWPPGVPTEETLDAFAAAFATLGYVPCSGEEPEKGVRETGFVRQRWRADACCPAASRRPLDKQARSARRHRTRLTCGERSRIRHGGAGPQTTDPCDAGLLSGRR